MSGSTSVPPGTPPPSPPPGGPTHPEPTHPPKVAGNAELLDLIDGQLVALLAVAYFGPAEQGTARSVKQVTAAEVLLFRLRMARKAVADLAAAFETPARRDGRLPAGAPVVAAQGGPVQNSLVSVRGQGEEGRAAGARGAAFRLPDTRVPLRFGEGEHRLVGRVGPEGPFPGSPPGPPPDPGPPPWVAARRRLAQYVPVVEVLPGLLLLALLASGPARLVIDFTSS